MEEIDSTLVRVWLLALEDVSDAVDDEIERLLPALEAAGYVIVDEHTWRFSPESAARAEELVPDADQLGIAARFDPPDARERYERWREQYREVLSEVDPDRVRIDVGPALDAGDFVRVWLPIKVALRCRVGEHSRILAQPSELVPRSYL